MKKIFVFTSLIAVSFNAAASDKISSPEVKKDFMELEYRGGYDFDHRAKKDNHQVHKFLANYGISDRLRPQLQLVTENLNGSDYEVISVDASMKWQFFKPDEAWLSSAAEVAYSKNANGNFADQIELKFLFGKDYGKFSNKLNIAWDEEVGEDSKNGSIYKAGFASTYNLSPYFSPGFEIYANTGNLRDGLTYDEQKHSFGPVFYGKLDDIKYQIGYLFGLTEATQDERLKLIVTYGVQF